MRTIERALRALIRNPLRSGLLVSLLTVSVALALVMITVSSAFGKQMDEIRDQVGSQVTVSTGGQGGFPGGGFPQGNSTTATTTTSDVVLTTDDASTLAGLDHVSSLEGTLRVSSIDTTLTPVPIQLPEGVQLPDNATTDTTNDDGTVQITTVGTSDPGSIVSSGDTTSTATTLVGGRLFTADELDAKVAVISESLAEQNGVAVGGTITVAGQSLDVVGIVSSSGGFRATDIYLPLTTMQTLLNRPGELSEVVLQVDDIDNVDSVATAVESTLGDGYTVSTSIDQYNRIAGTLQSAQRASQLALVVAGIASALVIVFGILLSARQRIKEIGILKAIGAANRQVAAQFGIETLIIGLIAGILGSLITFPLAQTVANGLTSSNSSTPGPRGGGGGGGGQLPFGGGQALAAGGGRFFGGIDVAVSPTIFLYALVFALILAVIASIGPAWQVSRIRPAEVLRHD